MTDFYKILGVSRRASARDITAAYKKLVSKYHPDRHQQNELRELAQEKLKELNEAYAVLSDPRQREQYDGGSPGPTGGYYQTPTVGPPNFQRILFWALAIILTPLAVKFLRHPKVAIGVLIVAFFWFLKRWMKRR